MGTPTLAKALVSRRMVIPASTKAKTRTSTPAVIVATPVSITDATLASMIDGALESTLTTATAAPMNYRGESSSIKKPSS
jgi:hypothetical protein